ncbi:MAG: transposase [Deltaproteobacteria bacterium]|nr:transposase [Deltaproteobacteria bacterium]
MHQSQPLRIEDSSVASFCTSRCVNSLLWFVNNSRVEERMLGYLAMYQQKYSVIIYAYKVMGNHVHLGARFPLRNRSEFMRDLNARTAEGVRYYVDEFEGGQLFGCRYSEQGLVESEDIEDKVFYCALQPVHHGLCRRISEHPQYNSFYDAISGITREYPVVDWAAYNKKRRSDPDVSIEEFTSYYPLIFSRPEEFQEMSQNDYKKKMLEKLEQRRVEIIAKKMEQGFIYPEDVSYLKELNPGTKPRTTKKSGRHDKRPRFFCKNPIKKLVKEIELFNIYCHYKFASSAYMRGDERVKFPDYTYKPPGFLVRPKGGG